MGELPGLPFLSATWPARSGRDEKVKQMGGGGQTEGGGILIVTEKEKGAEGHTGLFLTRCKERPGP